MDQSEMSEIRTALLNLIAKNKVAEAMDQLEQLIPVTHTKVYKPLILFRSDFEALKAKRVNGVESTSEIDQKERAFKFNLVEFISSLQWEDINMPRDAAATAQSTSNSKNKTGSVLYAIPPTMEMDKEHKCTVRLAFDEAYLSKECFASNDVNIKSLRRIGSRMEVEIIDPNAESIFEVRGISTPVQIVEEDDFTEWLYFVKPLREGVHELWLKVIIITMQEGERVRKDIVLQERIEVVTHAAEPVAVGQELKHSGLFFTLALPSVGELQGGNEPGHTTEAVESAALAGGTTSSGALSFLGSTFGKVAAGIGALAVIGGLWFATSYWEKGGELAGSPSIEANSGAEAYASFAGYSEITPVKRADYEPEAFLIDPTRDTVLYLSTGTSVSIPANSIVSPSFSPLSDQVEVRVKEIHQAHEIIASGIPMRFYNQHRQEQWLQSAGMFEIRAFQNGKQMEVASGKPISVRLVSNVQGAYDFWKFDEAAGNWVKQDADNLPEMTRLSKPGLDQEIRQLEQQLSVKIAKPEQFESYEYLASEIDLSCCPELKPINGRVLLTHAGIRPELARDKHDDWLNQRKWFARTLSRSQFGEGIYKFEWKGDTTFTTYVRQPSQKFDAEMEARLARYDSLMKERKSQVAILQRKRALQREQSAFQRSVQVNGFGIYNFDVLWDREDILALEARFNFGELEQALAEEVTVYLITGEGRTVIKYPEPYWKQFRFSPGSDNQLVALLPGGEAWVFKTSDFEASMAEIKKAAGKSSPYRFNLKKSKHTVSSAEDLKKILDNPIGDS